MTQSLFGMLAAGTIGAGVVLGHIHKPVEPLWTLIATGDIIPARSVNYQMTTRNDFLWPIRNIAPLLMNADLSIINLESPLIPHCPVTNDGMVFCGDQRFIKALQFAGVDLANLANNHTLNYGWEGLKTTENSLNKTGIETTGPTTEGTCAYQPYFCSKKVIKTVKGVTVGFVGYTIVGKEVDEEALYSDIVLLDNQVDVLVVSFHWGREYNRQPIGAPDDPRAIGKHAVDMGADVVIGNHPHWIQGMEYYRGKPIFYALGNTIFDQEWSQETKEGIIAEMSFRGTTVQAVTIHPLRITNYGYAQLASGPEKTKLLDVFTNASRDLATVTRKN
ncbi:MAG: CapA family protein [Patescibacteria group bacterium]